MDPESNEIDPSSVQMVCDTRIIKMEPTNNTIYKQNIDETEENSVKIKEETIDLDELIIPYYDTEPVEANIKKELNEEGKEGLKSKDSSTKSLIEIQKPFQCELCLIRFKQETSLNCHIASVHEGKKPFLQCEYCNMKFTSKRFTDQKWSLMRHIASVHDGKKRFECDICNKQYTNKVGLEAHISTDHVGEKPFQCSSCDAKYAYKAHLSRHFQIVHQGIKPFQCTICKVKFTNKGSLNKHVDSVHEGKKPFQCDICQKSFTQKASMTTHILTIHEGKKPHQCEICDERFTMKHHMKRHLKSAHSLVEVKPEETTD